MEELEGKRGLKPWNVGESAVPKEPDNLPLFAKTKDDTGISRCLAAELRDVK